MSIHENIVKTANIVSLDASKLTGVMPAISGANLTGVAPFTVSASDPVITTNPSVLKFSKKKIQNIHFFMTPVDKNIECFDVYKLNPHNDVFYAMSHGVNRATLKEGKTDNRVNFLNKLINNVKKLLINIHSLKKIIKIYRMN